MKGFITRCASAVLVKATIAACVGLTPGIALAQEEAERVFDKFRPYEPNYLIYQATEGDDTALEARYSFRYLLFTPDDNVRSQTGAFLKFTGEFDFYISRSSSPVINRISNPGGHYRWYKGGSDVGGLMSWNYWGIGIEHLSNGQAFDADVPENATLLQNAFLSDSGDEIFDEVSRSMNFFSLEGSYRFGRNRNSRNDDDARYVGNCPEAMGGCWNLNVRLIPLYIDDDNPVTWGPDAGIDEVSDYDRVRTILTKQQRLLRNDIELGVEWTVGDEGFDTDSLDIFAYLPEPRIGGIKLPFSMYIRYHRGPLNNLSDYTRDQNSIGVGLRLY